MYDAREELIKALNKLWGNDYDDDTNKEISADSSPWKKRDMSIIQEVLSQKDDTYGIEGYDVIMAAYAFMQEEYNKRRDE
jgi:hypothetical protein